MKPETKAEANVKQAAPFFGGSNLEASIRYYVDSLGFELTNGWTRASPAGVGSNAGARPRMPREFWTEGRHANAPEGKVGEGVSICFIREDALAFYREVRSRGIQASKPFVGNRMWAASLTDPDGYRLEFESYTDAPEKMEFSAREG